MSQLLQERPAWGYERDAEREHIERLDTGNLVGLACQLLTHTYYVAEVHAAPWETRFRDRSPAPTSRPRPRS